MSMDVVDALNFGCNLVKGILDNFLKMQDQSNSTIRVPTPFYILNFRRFEEDFCDF